ncbi:Coproporphyrinogen III oxidase, oxygen-independent [Candidatus Rhodobacter oscarellae]|uniref:Coproporphyrinogen-III oxidase n=1 Tax=Candidatus Rhodobacter oscarellae TaxID=1675527 RepID=A0A0J9EBQ9_9RHOB|nr:oxygen-independent coproporphyrinogen III oxidase [Candidatus Rhodobacter lobularis]KMW60081.1 Coproporphyrinogen III oxidase, oxygen-independent [Candidatus Rhodobacter lobularis]
MEKISTLRHYGLFDAKVPRYTSYPPANRFQQDVGARNQQDWLASVPPGEPVSVYVHIPFCRRLCWFCACRTQGTKTLAPVEGYVADLIAEIQAVAALLPKGVPMARLHLGGGTPTLLTQALMEQLLEALFDAFERTEDFEFSVEIDPTEAAPDLLEALARWGMRRASIGVQDFNPTVQKAIGRPQSFEQTRLVADLLRAYGVGSLNVDLLYGLPHQSESSLLESLDRVISLGPDRLALYGYAHVPHVSKRQVMIPMDDLPDAETRFQMSERARERLLSLGFCALGIDHFARPEDSLAKAAGAGHMRRNFQGYTDDPCETLLGFGASAISKFRQGYSQNAVSTAAYRQRVQTSGRAGHKGYQMTPGDRATAALIEALMCEGRVNVSKATAQTPSLAADARGLTRNLLSKFPDILAGTEEEIVLRQEFGAAARLIAADLDASLMEHNIHSKAI